MYGASDLVNKLDCFVDFLFFSVGIYNTVHMQKHLSFAYIFSYTVAPHTGMIMAALEHK
jgi:hypothetical protein